MKLIKCIYISFCILIIWTIFIIFIQILHLNSINVLNSFFQNSKFTNEELLLFLSDNKHHENILCSFFDQKNERIHFYDLPKRKYGLSFSEVTSANRDGRHSLASDFSFFLEYGDNWVTLINDLGCGCINRLYIYPPLPTDMSLYKMTPSDLASMYLLIKIDDKFEYEYSLKDMAKAEKFPFFYPMSTRFSCPVSGISSYVPICYNSAINIKYKHNKMFPENLFNLTIVCSLNELQCPIKMYSGISLMKYPLNQKCPVRPFNDNIPNFEKQLNSLAFLLKTHSSIEPDLQECLMQCRILNYGESVTIFYEFKIPQVINLLRFNILLEDDGPVKIWDNILLTLKADGTLTPNIYEVPLSSFFGSREFKGASYGRKLENCCYNSEDGNFCFEYEIGYFLLPIPFWKSVEVNLEFSKGVKSSERLLKVCYQVNVIPNYYDIKSTARLNVKRKYYSGDVSKTRNFFDVNGSWGHVVGVLIEIENLMPHLDGPSAATWAALQSDILIFVDGVKTPVAMGTGLEDYFSYAHGFANAANTTFSFVGLHHSSDRANPGFRKVSAATRHCYRQHLLDPIVFNSQICMLMEGMDDDVRGELAVEINLEEFEELKRKGEECFAYTVIYYSKKMRRPVRYITPFDGQQLSVVESRLFVSNKHNIYKPKSLVRSSGAWDTNCSIFYLCTKNHYGLYGFKSSHSLHEINFTNVNYIGGVISLDKYNGCALNLTNATNIKFFVKLPYKTLSPIVSIKRTSYCVPFQTSILSEISINNSPMNKWFIQTGCLNHEFSLIEQSIFFTVGLNIQNFNINIIQYTNTFDVSYTLCEVSK